MGTKESTVEQVRKVKGAPKLRRIGRSKYRLYRDAGTRELHVRKRTRKNLGRKKHAYYCLGHIDLEGSVGKWYACWSVEDEAWAVGDSQTVYAHFRLRRGILAGLGRLRVAAKQFNGWRVLSTP